MMGFLLAAPVPVTATVTVTTKAHLTCCTWMLGVHMAQGPWMSQSGVLSAIATADRRAGVCGPRLCIGGEHLVCCWCPMRCNIDASSLRSLKHLGLGGAPLTYGALPQPLHCTGARCL